MISDLYLQSPALAEAGTHVVSVDEKTGIQALERIAPTKPPAPGQIEKREFEYTRHGTVCLIANLEVATGKVISPTLGPTRTEEDFLSHIRRTIATDPKASWVFVLDQLNTHLSAGLVRLVAKLCGLKLRIIFIHLSANFLRLPSTMKSGIDPAGSVNTRYVT